MSLKCYCLKHPHVNHADQQRNASGVLRVMHQLMHDVLLAASDGDNDRINQQIQ